MYRIELKPGEETALRTVEELVIGIRNGVITSRARIWHHAGQKWLPIEFHPHYRAALHQLETAPPASAEQAVTALPIETVSDKTVLADQPATLPVARQRRPVGWPIGVLAIGCILVAGAKLGAKLVVSAAPFNLASAMASGSPRAVGSPPAERPAAQPTPTAAPTTAPRPIILPEEAVALPTAVAAPKAVPGGGVVRGPVQVAPPLAAATTPTATDTAASKDDAIPAAPSLTATDLGLPSVPQQPAATVEPAAVDSSSSRPGTPETAAEPAQP